MMVDDGEWIFGFHEKKNASKLLLHISYNARAINLHLYIDSKPLVSGGVPVCSAGAGTVEVYQLEELLGERVWSPLAA